MGWLPGLHGVAMKLTATRSPKFRRLMNLTGLSRPAAAGTLELLWLFTMEQAPSGDVGRWGDIDLEAELDWSGEPGALIDALVSAGWLDRCATHRLVIHDWADHLPDFLQKRVDRGTLTIAVTTPCPDTDGHRPPSSANGGIREGKGREAEPREEKGSEEKNPPAPRSPRVSGKRPCPEFLDEEAVDRIREWGSANGIEDHRLPAAWECFRDWAHSGDKRQANWEAGFRNALRRGWVLERRSANETGEAESAAQAKVRRSKEAAARVIQMLDRKTNGGLIA